MNIKKFITSVLAALLIFPTSIGAVSAAEVSKNTSDTLEPYLYTIADATQVQRIVANLFPYEDTGTRYLNVVGMLPFENEVSDYISSTNNHVMYRVTPMFEGDNLVASGVEMEGFSVEDSGAEICFNVYCYNVQPNVKINYANGDSEEINDTLEYITENSKENTYILNINTKKFHKLDCSSVNDIKSANKKEYSGDREILIEQGYTPCKTCNP